MSYTALIVDTAPAVTPLTVAEAKTHLRVEHAEDDDYISDLIDVAVARVDATGSLGRAMITQTWAQWVPQSPGWVRLELGPFQSLSSVKYYDSDGALQTATLSDYETRLDGDRVWCKPKDGFAWPTAATRDDAIKITYVAGFGDATSDVPAGIRHALLMLIAHWYESREGVAGERAVAVPLGVEALIGDERVGWYG